MSGKRKRNADGGKSMKKSRKSITLEKKYDILILHGSGMKVNEIATMFQLSHSTISTILKDKEKYINELKRCTPMQSTLIRSRKGLIAEMEKLLIAWINEQSQPCNQQTISTKAKALFEALKISNGEASKDEFFSASKGWYDRFKKRSGWRGAKSESTAIRRTEKLPEIIEVQVSPKDVIELDTRTPMLGASEDQITVKNEPAEIDHLESPHDFTVRRLTESLHTEKEEAAVVKSESTINKDLNVWTRKDFIMQRLSLALDHINSAMDIFKSIDPNRERCSKVIDAMENACSCYKEIYNDNKETDS